jgi:hypothetical protein
MEQLGKFLHARSIAGAWEPACGEGHMAEIIGEFATQRR